MKNILITGGAGFIGSNLVKHFVNKYSEYNIVVYDSLTYAGDLKNLQEIEDKFQLVIGDICENNILNYTLVKYKIDSVIHLAAESHVDRSITNPDEFAMTNVIGTLRLLNEVKNYWNGNFEGKKFYHISTDEVYGSIDEGLFTEENSIDPKSPYSASKASSDLFVLAYHNTYKLPVVISRCSNNYGENQYPEKLLPLIIHNILHEKPLPIYGDGMNVRDWLYVGDHCNAIDTIFHHGELGEVYNIGGNEELENINFVHLVCSIMDKKLKRENSSTSLIKFVTDRAGHDRRYAIDSTKLSTKLGWNAEVNLYNGLEKTIDWYITNQKWLDSKIK